MRDLSEQQTAMEALSQSEGLYRTLFRESREPMFLRLEDPGFLEVNQAWLEDFGYTAEEACRLEVTAMVVHLGEWARFHRLLRSQDLVKDYELRERRKDGSVRESLVTAASLRAFDGRVIGYYGISRDVTAQREAERDLHRANRELSLLQRFGARVGASLDLARIYSAAEEVLRDDLGFVAGVLLTPNADGGALAVAAAWGLHGSTRERVCARWNRRWPALKSTWRPRTAARWLRRGCIPLESAGGLQGVVDLVLEQPGPLDGDTRALLRILGQQTGAALHNTQLYAKNEDARTRLEAHSRQLVESQEAQRRRLAQELHDEVGQLLTGLRLSLALARRATTPGQERHLDAASALAGELLDRVREISLELRPAMLDTLGLLPALLWHFKRYSVLTGIQVRFAHAGIKARFPPSLETAAYRIVQEALTNVARHAGVAEARVRVWADETLLGLRVEDSGAGFDPKAVLAAGSTAGVSGLVERARLAGGYLHITSAAGAGTAVTAEFPLGDAAQVRERPDE